VISSLSEVYSATNSGVCKLAERSCMQLKGTRRKHLYLEGDRVDALEYRVLRDEFR